LPSKGYAGYPSLDVSRNRTFLRASHDGGTRWGVIYPMDSDEYPGGRGGFSAAHGHLVVAYGTMKVPASENAQCPCTVFGTSQDDGKTFHYHVVPPLAAVPPSAPIPDAGRGGRGAGAGGAILLAADATKEGRYALAQQSGNQILISLTEDGGDTWQPPVVAAQVPSDASIGHRAMRYSPQGDLGLIWKATYPDGSFDVWSSASRDGAHTFKTIRVSHTVSPTYSTERGNFLAGDDLSSMDIDSDYLYVVWGDNRSGYEGTWFARVPLSTY
jgi:hypothetical protein